MTTRRAAEQEHFGSATRGEGQAADARAEDGMIDEGAADSATPEEVVRGFFETVFNDGEVDAVERFIAPDHENNDPTAPDVPPGPRGVRMLAHHYREAFPDLRFTFEEVLACDDHVAHRWLFTGTHRGEIMGIAPTGRRVEFTGIEINRVERGRIAESWTISDAGGLREQLEATG